VAAGGIGSALAAGDAIALVTEDPDVLRGDVAGTGLSPLCAACFAPGLVPGSPIAAGLVECIEVLLAAGADPHEACRTPDAEVLPLVGASRNPDAARLLLEAGGAPRGRRAMSGAPDPPDEAALRGLLLRPGPRFATAYLDLRIRTDVDVQIAAMAAAGWSAYGGAGGGVSTRTLGVWLDGPCARVEDGGRLQVLGPQTAWMVAGDQVDTWPRRPDAEPEDDGAVLALLLHPERLVTTHEAHPIGTSQVAGLDTWSVRATPRAGVEEAPWLLEGRDVAELEVDVEHGVPLAVTTRFCGKIVDEVEAAEAVFDEPIDPARFRYEPD
jgi:hypothetical protein